ncbi:MAG: SDR family oxidoreductase [Acidobacteria bacterium]|nr:SDR family oxidoreductase [Acidobacteriota bacterium]
MSRLEGKAAIVTGGGKGIGHASCKRLAQEGAQVAIADIDYEAARAVAAELAGKGEVDVSDWESVQEMASCAAQAFGGIDVLVNNAALYSTLQRKPFHEISPEEWDRVMAVNLRGPFLCARAVYPFMKVRGKGKIINISSSSVLSKERCIPRPQYPEDLDGTLVFLASDDSDFMTGQCLTVDDGFRFY